MYFNESMNQANTRGEFHRAGTRKKVDAREKGFPWRKYKKHYVWKQVLPGGYALVYHKHAGSTVKKWGHFQFDWVWIGNEYPFGMGR